MSNNKKFVPARLILPVFKNISERRKWLRQQTPEFIKMLTSQERRDAGASSRRRHMEKKKEAKDQEKYKHEVAP
jgi:hypothetical protein